MANVDDMRARNLGSGGIRDVVLNPGEVRAGVNAKDVRGAEPEDEVDGRDRFDKVGPPVKGALEESRRDLVAVGDIDGNGYS